MYSRCLKGRIYRMAAAIGENQFCNECRRSFHSSSDGCPRCGSMKTISTIDIEEIKTVEISADEYFVKYGYIPILNDDGDYEIIFNEQSCPWPRQENEEE